VKLLRHVGDKGRTLAQPEAKQNVIIVKNKNAILILLFSFLPFSD